MYHVYNIYVYLLLGVTDCVRRKTDRERHKKKIKTHDIRQEELLQEETKRFCAEWRRETGERLNTRVVHTTHYISAVFSARQTDKPGSRAPWAVVAALVFDKRSKRQNPYTIYYYIQHTHIQLSLLLFFDCVAHEKHDGIPSFGCLLL